MGWNGAASKRRPWPYDLYIGDTKVLLDPGQDGNLVASKSKTLDQIAPTNYEYGSANPFVERTESWNQLYGGFGELIQPETRPRRYQYAQRADLSVDGYWMKGPNFENHIETISASAGEVRQLIKALDHGVETIFAICQFGIWRRISDGNWTPSLTLTTTPPLPSNTFPQQAVRFRGRGAAPGDYLYVAMSAGNIWEYTGTTWSQAAGAAGPLNPIDANDGQARWIERVADELWVAGDTWVVKVEEDPFDRTKYAGAIYIGDQNSKITYLKCINKVLYIFKTDGIYTIDTAGLDQELFPTLRGKIAATNGRNASVWMNRMWFSFQDDTYTIDTNAVINPDGLEQMLENVSDVRGRFIGGAGHNTWFFYEVYYNAFSGKSYLVKHGTWTEDTTREGAIHFSDSHHGSLAEWSKQASCAQILPGLHSSGNDRLYVGFLNGTVEWCVLPLSSPNPANDTSCEFTNLDSWVYLPIHHANFQADNKFWRGVSTPGPHLTATEYAVVQYRHDLINPTGTWLTLNPDNPNFTLPGMRHNFPTVNPIYSKNILFRVKLVKDPVLSPINQTPVLEGINIHEAIRPAISLQYIFSIKAGSFLPRHNGSTDRRRGSLIRDELLAAASQVGAILLRLNDGTTQEVLITDYKETMVPKQKRRDVAFNIQITCLQLKTFTNIAVESGITYRTLERYTLGQLENLL